jgi:Iron-binding zinc finger CDGSH type
MAGQPAIGLAARISTSANERAKRNNFESRVFAAALSQVRLVRTLLLDAVDTARPVPPTAPESSERSTMTSPVPASDTPFAVDVEQGKDYGWCACGQSKAQPFCDGSHENAA